MTRSRKSLYRLTVEVVGDRSIVQRVESALKSSELEGFVEGCEELPLNRISDILSQGISGIHGIGIFARRRIRKGEIIVTEKGEGVPKGFNHSCTPNMRRTGVHERVAAGDIPKGTEITVSYGSVPPSECQCPTCRKRR